MDSRKTEILKLSKQALELKKNKKNEDFTIKKIDANIKSVESQLTQLQEQINTNNAYMEEYNTLEIKKQKKHLKYWCALMVEIAIGALWIATTLSTLSICATLGIVLTTAIFYIHDLNEIMIKQKEDISRIPTQNNELEKKMQSLENKKKQLTKERNKNSTMKQQNEERYQVLTEQIINLTKERQELADQLLEQEESPVIHVDKRAKSKRSMDLSSRH